MNNKLISYKAALSFGFNGFINNFFTFFMICLANIFLLIIGYLIYICSLCSMGFFYGFGVYFGLPRIFVTICMLLIMVVSAFLTLGAAFSFCHYQYARFALAIYEGKPFKWTNFFQVSGHQFISFCFARLWRWISTVAIMVFTVVSLIWMFHGYYFARYFVVVGLPCIIPSVYWACKYYFAGYSLLDKRSTSITEDRRYNRELTNGVKWQILGFMIILFCLCGLMFFIVFLTAPFFYLSIMHVYKQLQQQVDESARIPIHNSQHSDV